MPDIPPTRAAIRDDQLRKLRALIAAIVPGKPAQSALVSLITPHKGVAEMPKDAPALSEPDRALITRWIEPTYMSTVRMDVQKDTGDVSLLAAQHGVDLSRVCWLAFGSEGRSEQTIATDQDNGIVFEVAPGKSPDEVRERIGSQFQSRVAPGNAGKRVEVSSRNW